jgi:ATP-dependent RNA helicase RhlE
LTNFTDLALDARLMRALEAESYATPTPIQAKAIPPVMRGVDLLGIAQTGTGKTAAFALPILHRLAAERRAPERKCARVLVLSPTRELASQIADSFRTYGRHMQVRVAVVFGGVGHRPQVEAMARGVDVLVATPGRLLDHMGERSIDLRATEILVLDEADQMLDLGFLPAIRRIIGQLPKQRQNLFFSATMPAEIGKLAGELLRAPVKVEITPAATTVERVSQRVIHVEHARKRELLVELLRDAGMQRTLVFTRTKRGADRVARHLTSARIEAAAIHGNKSQRQREQALDAFKSGDIRVLVATDIAARGIDVEEVSHVVNYELPEVPEQYVHRIGRTARAGAAGVAISLCDGEERGLLRDIERLTRLSLPSEDRRSANGVAPAEAPVRGRPDHATRARRNDGHRDDGRRHDARQSQQQSRQQRSDRRAPNGHDRPASGQRVSSAPTHQLRNGGEAGQHGKPQSRHGQAPRQDGGRSQGPPQRNGDHRQNRGSGPVRYGA